MGRFHPHTDGTLPRHDHHDHDHDEHDGDGHEAGHSHDAEHDGADERRPRDVGDHSGYPDTGSARVSVLEDILSENDRVAADNRRAFTAAGVRAVNLMSSPGAGKATLLKRTLEALSGRTRIGILEGDIATSLDADQLAGCGAAIALVNTSAGFGGECHLDAVMVRSGISRLPLDEINLLIIEDVGNLVCPAEFAVGEHAKATVLGGCQQPGGIIVVGQGLRLVGAREPVRDLGHRWHLGLNRRNRRHRYRQALLVS